MARPDRPDATNNTRVKGPRIRFTIVGVLLLGFKTLVADVGWVVIALVAVVATANIVVAQFYFR